MKINYLSLGCKVNLYETMAVVNMFIDEGYELVSFDSPSDVTIINTCTVTQTSDSKSRKMVRQVARNNPGSIICVMGCYSQLNSSEASKIEGVSIVVGTSNRHLIYDLVKEKISGKTSLTVNRCQAYHEMKEYEDISVLHYENKTRAFVKIQDGCENFCSYCTIPYSRGPFRSRNKESIIKEIKSLTDLGMKEIVLTGINTGAYGKDLNGYTLSSLLKDIISSVNNLGRIRISSIEITEVTDELVEMIASNNDHFCNHLHIPLQGGTDEILQKMNRKYDLDYYKSRIDYCKSRIKDINITADILCGFNGETDELFDKAFAFIESMQFGETHIFPYSPRIRTKAYADSKLISFKDRVNGTVLKQRVKRLLNLNRTNAIYYRNKFLGREVSVLVEKVEDGVCFGHSSNYLEVSFKSPFIKENDLVDVTITKVSYPVCEGKIRKD